MTVIKMDNENVCFLIPLCSKFISNERVFRKIEVRIFEALMYCIWMDRNVQNYIRIRQKITIYIYTDGQKKRYTQKISINYLEGNTISDSCI